MKRASYKAAIVWIAENDSAGDSDALDEKVASELITSILVADLFDVTLEKVGRDVVKYRKTSTDYAQVKTHMIPPAYARHSKLVSIPDFYEPGEGDESNYKDLPAAGWCKNAHIDGQACNDCGPIIESHLMLKEKCP